MEATVNGNTSGINWQDKYIDKLASYMDSIKGMENRLMTYIESRMERMELRMDRMELKHSEEISDLNKKFDSLNEKIDANNKYTHTLAVTCIAGIGAVTVGILGIIAAVVIAIANIFYK